MQVSACRAMVAAMQNKATEKVIKRPAAAEAEPKMHHCALLCQPSTAYFFQHGKHYHLNKNNFKKKQKMIIKNQAAAESETKSTIALFCANQTLPDRPIVSALQALEKVNKGENQRKTRSSCQLVTFLRHGTNGFGKTTNNN